MDYITSGILKKINSLRKKNSSKIYSTLAQYYRLLFEYHLKLMFACLWNRKERSISIALRREIIKAMNKPVLGTMLNAILEMNKTGDPVFALPANYEEHVRRFINIRNQNFGHGILVPLVQEESYRELCNELENYYKQLAAFEQTIWGDNCEFVLRSDPVDVGQINVFLSNRDTEYRDVEKRFAESYLQHELYFSCAAGRFRVSPFLLPVENLETEYEFYFYTEYKVQSGKFDYYLVSRFSNDFGYTETFPDFFTGYREKNEYTIQCGNGVVSNRFDNNYDYFVNIAPFTKYVTQIWDFLIKNQSNTCLTIRGGGGIGKTALVQYICTKYLFERVTENPEFNYVIFCSAKNRKFELNSDTERGQIYYIDKEKIIDSYREILRTACRVLEIDIDLTEKTLPDVEEAFLNESGVLLIVDDFETLPDAEKEKVVHLIERMNIKRHKVLITTRSQYFVGAVFDVEPMNAEQVVSFMEKLFDNLANPNSIVKKQFRELIQKVSRKKIYEVTAGLPLLAIQLALLLPVKGFDEKLLSKRFTDDAEDFLLGKLYSYFKTRTLKLLFLLIACFVCDLRQIPLKTLEIFYDLHCRRLNFDNVDFNDDLKELRRWNIIRIEDDFILVSNNISHEIFNECRKEFLVEYPSENLFDKRLFKFVAENKLRGVLDYIDAPAALVDEALTEIFAFENVGNFTNDERCRVVKALITRYNGDTAKIQSLCNRGEGYFDSCEEYFRLFAGYGVRPMSENLTNNSSATSGLFEEINRKLLDIQTRCDELFSNVQHPSRAFLEKFYQQLRNELGQICAIDLRNALANFTSEDVPVAKTTEQFLYRINRNQPFKFIGHENCQALFDLLDNVSD